jgi:hypothetical protein
MNVQQIIALLIVSVAAAYLFRNAVRTLRAFLSGRGGCASGCGKCGFAGEIASRRKAASSPRSDVIPLTDIRSVTDKRRHG